MLISRITITADDVRELMRHFPEWKQVPSAWDGLEAWRWRDTDWFAWIPVMPDAPAKADYQTRLWDAVRDVGDAMGIGTDIFVRFGMMLQERRQSTVPEPKPRDYVLEPERPEYLDYDPSTPWRSCR